MANYAEDVLSGHQRGDRAMVAITVKVYAEELEDFRMVARRLRKNQSVAVREAMRMWVNEKGNTGTRDMFMPQRQTG